MRLVTARDAQSIGNRDYRDYVMRFARVQRDLHRTMESYGLPLEPAGPEERERVRKLRESLASRGAMVRNDGKSIVAGRLSPACERCRTGIRSVSQFLSLACPHSCWFCFNENQHDYELFKHGKTPWRDDLHAYADEMGKLDFIALTGGEPMLYPDEANAFFVEAKTVAPDSHCRLYTSGFGLDESALQRLAESGLDEIRFSVKVDVETGSNGESGALAKFPSVEEQLAMVERAVGIVPAVMVEMPVVPGTGTQMRTILRELDRMGVFGINLLEFCFPLHNAGEYSKRGFSLVEDPYRIPYSYTYAGSLPVHGSEELALQLMSDALDEGLGLGMHYCSLENKNTAQIYEQNHGGVHDIQPYRFSDRDFFYHVARAFGADAKQVARKLDAAGMPYESDGKDTMVAFDPTLLPLFAANVEKTGKPKVFLAAAVIEPTEDGGERFREVGLQLLEPGDFDGNI